MSDARIATSPRSNHNAAYMTPTDGTYAYQTAVRWSYSVSSEAQVGVDRMDMGMTETETETKKVLLFVRSSDRPIGQEKRGGCAAVDTDADNDAKRKSKGQQHTPLASLPISVTRSPRSSSPSLSRHTISPPLAIRPTADDDWHPASTPTLCLPPHHLATSTSTLPPPPHSPPPH
ncbi:hypothetical protein R3P38DRAFT_3266850 [Favolaschia claudopus]|uniref:Uncharacterized protein n=1 Tax=Favolaschia claudopus TaxID=2862362 RepID=A0AAW0BU62_9AGAR